MKFLVSLTVFVCLAGSLALCSELAYYVDEKGHRVYINAPEPPPAKTVKGRNRHRSSVLVRQNPQTKEMVEVPPPAEPIQAVQTPAARPKAPEQPVVAQAQTPRPEAAEITRRPALSMPWPNIGALIQETADRHAVDARLVRAVVQVESNFNPWALSHKGAMGLMQLVPGTARRFGVGNAFNPVENVDGGVRYLKYLLGMFGGDVKLSVAAYNAGEKAVERHGGVPPYAETRDYVRKIATVYHSDLALNANDAAPAIPPAPSITPPRNRRGIVKYVDENGRVHFSNDLP